MKTALLLLIALLAATPCMAQNKSSSSWELFTGYSFLWANVREYRRVTSPPTFVGHNAYTYLNGWEVSLTENVNRRIGGTLEVSGYYASPTVSGTSTSEELYSVLYGPQISFRKRWGNPFVHALLGASHASVKATPTGPHTTITSFAFAAGGGADLNFGTRTAIRVFQVDYIRPDFLPSTTASGGGSTTQHDIRISAGLVFHLTKTR